MTANDQPNRTDAGQPHTGAPQEPSPELETEEDGETNGDVSISRRTLSMIDEAMVNVRAGVVGEPLDVDALRRAVSED